jgi:hypothetical protein
MFREHMPPPPPSPPRARALHRTLTRSSDTNAARHMTQLGPSAAPAVVPASAGAQLVPFAHDPSPSGAAAHGGAAPMNTCTGKSCTGPPCTTYGRPPPPPMPRGTTASRGAHHARTGRRRRHAHTHAAATAPMTMPTTEPRGSAEGGPPGTRMGETGPPCGRPAGCRPGGCAHGGMFGVSAHVGKPSRWLTRARPGKQTACGHGRWCLAVLPSPQNTKLEEKRSTYTYTYTCKNKNNRNFKHTPK